MTRLLYICLSARCSLQLLHSLSPHSILYSHASRPDVLYTLVCTAPARKPYCIRICWPSVFYNSPLSLGPIQLLCTHTARPVALYMMIKCLASMATCNVYDTYTLGPCVHYNVVVQSGRSRFYTVCMYKSVRMYVLYVLLVFPRCVPRQPCASCQWSQHPP